MLQSNQMEERVVSAIREFARSIKPWNRVVSDISPIVSATSKLNLSNFDYWERLIRSEFSLAMKKNTPPKWMLWSKPSEILTWLDLTSWDGYKREKTLLALSGGAPNAFLFSLVIRRLNDWVPQVRLAARQKLPEIAQSTAPENVVEALCVALSNWSSWGRIEDADKKILLEIVSEAPIAESFRKKLISSASGPMASLFSQLGRTSIFDGKVEEIAQFAIQPSLRAKAYRSLFEGRITWVERREWVWTDIRYCEGKLKPVLSERKLAASTPFLELLKRSSKDRSSIVRHPCGKRQPNSNS